MYIVCVNNMKGSEKIFQKLQTICLKQKVKINRKWVKEYCYRGTTIVDIIIIISFQVFYMFFPALCKMEPTNNHPVS